MSKLESDRAGWTLAAEVSLELHDVWSGFGPKDRKARTRQYAPRLADPKFAALFRQQSTTFAKFDMLPLKTKQRPLGS